MATFDHPGTGFIAAALAALAALSCGSGGSLPETGRRSSGSSGGESSSDQLTCTHNSDCPRSPDPDRRYYCSDERRCELGRRCALDGDCNSNTELCRAGGACWQVPQNPRDANHILVVVRARFTLEEQNNAPIFRGSVFWRAGFENPVRRAGRTWSPANLRSAPNVANFGVFEIPWPEVCSDAASCDVLIDVDAQSFDCGIDHYAVDVTRVNRRINVAIDCVNAAPRRSP